VQNPFVQLLDEGLDASSPPPAGRSLGSHSQAFYPVGNTVRFSSWKASAWVGLPGSGVISRYTI